LALQGSEGIGAAIPGPAPDCVQVSPGHHADRVDLHIAHAADEVRCPVDSAIVGRRKTGRGGEGRPARGFDV
jgi:hypothetical protein